MPHQRLSIFIAIGLIAAHAAIAAPPSPDSDGNTVEAAVQAAEQAVREADAALKDRQAAAGTQTLLSDQQAARAPKADAVGAAALAGHYYLQGIHEVGSELLLRAGGSFEWALAYGAVDQAAKGRWRRERDRVVIEPAQPSKQAALFTQDAAMDWYGEAERKLLDDEREAEAEQVMQRCPFLGSADYASSVPAATLDSDSPPSKAELERTAQAKLPPLKSAVAALEAAAREAMAARSTGGADAAATRDALQRTQDAMDRYLGAQLEAREAYGAAGLDTATLPEPHYPAECRMPAETDDDPPEAAWRGGYAVIVGDPEAGLRFSGVTATFEFADGHRVEAVTDRGGFAGVRLRPASALRRITLAPRDERYPPESFAVAPKRGSEVFPFRIDSAGLSPPPFQRMELRIENGDLVPDWPEGGERGRYQRN